MTFDQIYIPEDADEVDVWAIEREFDMRYRLMERKREGMDGVVKKTTNAFKAFHEALTGDPSVPGMVRD